MMKLKKNIIFIFFVVVIFLLCFKFYPIFIEDRQQEIFLSGFFENALRVKNDEYFRSSMYKKVFNDEQLSSYRNFFPKNGYMLEIKMVKEDWFNILLDNKIFKTVNYHFLGSFTKNPRVRFSATLIMDDGKWYFYGFRIISEKGVGFESSVTNTALKSSE